MRRSYAVAAGMAAVLAGSVVAPAASEAASNPYSPQQICGAGFGVIDSVTLPGSVRRNKVMARSYLLYNAATGQNCATTVKHAAVGRPSRVAVSLRRRGGPVRSDAGNFSYYAGPVKVQARGIKVQYTGSYLLGADSGGFESAFAWGGR